MSKPFRDITGQRFGYLIALARIERVKKNTYWLCRCDCGKEARVRLTHLRTGDITSCGCRHLRNGPKGIAEAALPSIRVDTVFNLRLKPFAVGQALKVQQSKLTESAFELYARNHFGMDLATAQEYMLVTPPKLKPVVERPIKATQPVGFVYFLSSHGLVKIGFSTRLEQRIQALRASSPVVLELVAAIPGTRQLETSLHQQFKKLRKHGEWFLAAEPLSSYILGLPP